MAYKMKGFSGFGNSPAKQKKEKTYPKSYTKKDIEFLKKQREDVVRREDLDEKGKKIFDRNQARLKTKTKDRLEPTYEGTDEFRKEKDIPKKEFKERGVKSPNKQIYAQGGLDDAAAFDKKYKQKTTSTQNFKKKFDARQTSKQKAKDFVKNLKAKGDLVSKKPTSTLGRVANIGKKALKAGGRFAGGIGAAGMLYEAYKSGQKHSGGKAVKGQKSFMADAKKNTKSIYKKK
jgi:hypothetical protein